MHISLDSALGQQRRLNQVGETISSIATPAAAYSLRSLTGGDPRVVRVRRASDNDEQDFTASEVASGAMLDYVNTQAIKPLDIKELVSTGRDGDFILANAAYSLRSLGTRQATVTSSGDTAGDTSGKYVVQVRRNVNGDQKSFTADEVSDGTLASFVNESFTSSLPLDVQGSAAAAYSLRKLKISGTPITSSGDTGEDTTGNYVVQVRRSSDDAVKSFTANEITDGTLLSFVNTGVSKLDLQDETGSLVGNVTNKTATGFDFSVNNEGSDGFRNLLASNSTEDGTYVITFDAVLNSGSFTGVNTRTSTPVQETQIVSGSNSITYNTTAGGNIHFRTTGTAVANVSITNITLTQTASNGFVKTWYDQSGNGRNATQSTNHFQPKIVSAGTVLVDSAGKPEIDFDGSNDAFNTSSGFTLTSSDDLSFFVVSEVDGVSNQVILSQDNGTGTGRSWIEYRQTSNFATSLSGGGPHQFGSYTANEKNLFSLIYDDSEGTIDAFKDGSQSGSQLTSKTVEAASGVLNIGESKDGAAFFDGTMQELIIYVSDQSEDRRAIEESISGHYGITLGAFNRNGFVRTWYDQSVTGQDATTGTPNGNHAVQTSVSKMPTIVSNGSLLTNGILFNTNINLPLSGTGLDLFKNVAHGNIFSIIKPEVTTTGTKRFFEASRNGGTTARFLFADGDDTSTNATFRVGGRTTDTGSFGDVEGTTTHGNAVSLLTGFISYTGDTGTLFLNGTQINQDTSMAFAAGNTQDTSSDAIAIGGSNAANSSNFSCQEMIIYTTDQTNNRTAIEANIGSAHGINLPDGFDPTNDKVDGFVETWYDQSGNNNNATQTTATSQPKIVNEGTYLDLVRTDGTDDFFDLTTQINFNSSHGVFAVYADANQNRYDLLSNGTNNTGIGYAFVGSTSMTFGMISNGAQERFSFGTGTRANQNLLSLLWQPDSASAIYSLNGSGNSQNFTLSRYISDTAMSLTVIGKDNDAIGQLDLKEIIIYATDQTSNRTKLEANIAAAHGITLS